MHSHEKLVTHSILLGIVAAGLATTTTAQINMRVFAHTKLVAGSKSVAKNTDITAGVNLRDIGSAPCYKTGSMSVTVSSPSVRVSCGSSTRCSTALAGFGTIRLRLTASKPTAGFIVANGDCPGSRSGFWIDVGNDGSQEIWAQSQFRGPRVLETPLVVTPAGVDVLVQCSASLLTATTFSCSADVTVRFVAGSSTTHVRRIGTSCGPELTATFAQTHPFFAMRTITLHASKLKQTSSWFLFGLRQTSVPLPPTNCPLLTDVVLPVWAVPSRGRASMSIRILQPSVSGQAYVQFVQAQLVSNQMHWTTSEAFYLQI